MGLSHSRRNSFKPRIEEDLGGCSGSDPLLAGDVSGRFRGPWALCKRACEATAGRQTRPAWRDARISLHFYPLISSTIGG